MKINNLKVYGLWGFLLSYNSLDITLRQAQGDIPFDRLRVTRSTCHAELVEA
jgi:hypothetical protein